MLSSPREISAVQGAAEFERPLHLLEDRLTALGLALNQQDLAAVDRVAAELHTALAAAMDHYSRAAGSGGVPPTLRRRLAQAGGQVAAQREALARATASLDRAIEVLIPRSSGAGGVYSAGGNAERGSATGSSLLA